MDAGTREAGVRWPMWAAVAVLSYTVAVVPMGTSDATPAPGSQLIGCGQADVRVTVSVSSHLDPSCTYHAGFDVVSSDVVLDCQGARLVNTANVRLGIAVTAPTTVALSDITVRNCDVEGFLNNLRVTRQGFKSLVVGHEYEHAFSNIVVENSTFSSSRGVGVFVDGFVTGVTLRNLDVSGAGSTGVYLEGSSKDNVVENSRIHDNGFEENGPSGQVIDLGGANFRWWGTGREGLAIDGSRHNRVTGNHFQGNSAGGIFLYKNCGEYATQKPNEWWKRNYGADGNTIEANTFDGGLNGVWVASRMGENSLPMDCGDEAYRSGPLERIVLDHAAGNSITGNTFNDVTYGVRVEDDATVVAGNRFTGTDPAQHAVIVGTRARTTDLGRPVNNTTITDNVSTIAGNTSPYRWIHGLQNTTFEDNTALGTPAELCEGQQPPVSVFIFVLAFAPQDPSQPPVAMPELLDQRLPVLTACPPTSVSTPSSSSGAVAGSGSPASTTAVVAVPRFTG